MSNSPPEPDESKGIADVLREHPSYWITPAVIVGVLVIAALVARWLDPPFYYAP